VGVCFLHEYYHHHYHRFQYPERNSSCSSKEVQGYELNLYYVEIARDRGLIYTHKYLYKHMYGRREIGILRIKEVEDQFTHINTYVNTCMYIHWIFINRNFFVFRDFERSRWVCISDKSDFINRLIYRWSILVDSNCIITQWFTLQSLLSSYSTETKI
jgi:hypothetical protein